MMQFSLLTFWVLLWLSLPSPCQAEPVELIVFSSDRDGDFEIYSMTPDGGSLQQLTNNEFDDRYPVLSPHGPIAYISNAAGKDDIYLLHSPGALPRRLTTAGTNRYPSFSPDSFHLLFISNRDSDYEVYRMNLNGGQQQKVTDNAYDDRSPSYAPDGKSIIFSSKRSASYDIYRMDADGGRQKMLFHGGDSWSPRYSPNGSTIAFYSNRDGDFEIFVMQADGTNPHRLTDDGGATYPCFSADGKSLVYSSYQDDEPQIYRLDLASGTSKRLLISAGQDMTPRWGVLTGP